MESLFSIFLLFVAAIVAILTYMYVPSMPIIALTTASAIALAAGIWWHWTQFSHDYRTSTWQEGFRNYASYVMVFAVIVLSYGFYVLVYSGSSLQTYAAQALTSAREVGTRVTSTIAAGTARAASALTSEEEVSAPVQAPPQARNVAANRNTGRNRSANFLT